MSKYGLTVMLCLLLAGGLIAGQTGAGLVTISGAPGTSGQTAPTFLDPTRAPEGNYAQAPQQGYQEDAVTWSTRAVYPQSGTYRGMIGAFANKADTSFMWAVGGQGYSYYPYNYEYNSRTNTWTQRASMPVGTSNQCAVYWADTDGSGQDSSGVFTFGTYGGASNTNCYYWRRSTNTWTQIASYSGSWYYGNMAAVIGDSVFVMLYNSPTFQRYDIRSNTWATRTSAPVSNYFGAMIAAQGKVYQAGGWMNQLTFQEYNPLTGSWTNKTAVPSNVGGNSPNLAPWDTGSVHRIYCWGGGNGWSTKSGCAWWDANSNAWTAEGTIPEGIIGAWFAFISEWPGPIIGINHACGYNGSSYITTHRRGVPDVPQPIDVGVTKIISPADPFYAFGDTFHFIAQVKNFGTAPQTNVPVHVIVRARTVGNIVFEATENVPNMAVGQTCTLAFTGSYAPAAVETVYVDSMRTELTGDGNPVNNSMNNLLKVTEWGSECMTYNDGTFDNAISWVAAGNELAEKFASPVNPVAINKAVVWLSSFSGADYAAEVRLYGNDGSGGAPGTQLGAWVGNLHSSIWTSLYKNEVFFDPVISVAYDTFYVSYYQTSISPAYPYCGMDYTPPVTTNNDWGKWQGSWGVFPYDGYMDFGIDACYQARLLDGTIVDITVPAATVDSNTTFDPQVVVKNAGLKARTNIPVAFNLVRTSDPADTLYSGVANSGYVGVSEEKAVDFTGANLTPDPDNFSMTGISMMPYDTKTENDTLQMPLFVRYLNVMTEIVSPRKQEVPGLVPISIRLTNYGNVLATVPRLDVTIVPSNYADFRENIEIPVGQNQVVTLNPWVCPAGGHDTCTAWITYPADMNHTSGTPTSADTAMRAIVTGIPGWAELTPLPAPPSGKPIKDGGCLAYDLGTDLIFGSKGNKTGDFYSYSVSTGTWTNLTGIPLGAEGKTVYKGSVICSDAAGTMYLTKGNNTVGFWKYVAADNKWTQLTNVPLGSSGKKVKQGCGIAWATKSGVGSVYLLKGYRNEFHKYDPATNSWTQLLDAPIGTANHIKYDAGSWLVSDAEPGGHMLYAFKAKYHEFYTYDTDADTWSHAKNAMPIPGSAGNKKAKDGSCAAWYSGKIYAFKGGNTVEFWRYFPLGDSWKKQDDIPLIGMTGSRKKVKAGAALAGYPGTGVYGFKGNKSLEFWRFTPYDVAVGAQPSRDGVTAGSVSIGSVGFAISPNPLAGGYATVRYSLPKAGLATLNVFDVAGRTVLSQTLAAGRTGTASLDLRKLEAGVYLVKVQADGFATTQKLVVEH